MRRVKIRRIVLIMLVMVLAVASLSYKEIDLRILGIHLQRGSEGVLGMRLGLDLQGGSHLVYQARGTNEIAVAFAEPELVVSTLDPNIQRTQTILQTLDTLELADLTVEITDDKTIFITVASLNKFSTDSTGKLTQPDSDVIREKLETRFGPIAIYEIHDENPESTRIDVVFADPLPVPATVSRRDQVRSALDELGKIDSSIRIDSDTAMLITVPSLRPEEKDAAGNLVRVADADAIRKSLEDLEEQIGNLSTFTVTQVEANPTANQMEVVLKTIEKRVNPYGIAEPVIQLMDNNRVLVQLPGLHDVEEVKRLIGRTARLEFKERECLANTAIATSNGSFYPCELPENHIDKETGLTGEDLERTFPGTEPTTGQPIVNVQFNSHGTRIFAELTRRLFQTLNTPTPDRFVVFLDNDEIIAPVVNQPILSGSAFIEGPDFTPDLVRTIAIQLESGILPVPLELVQELNVNATLGQRSLEKSLVAGIAGLLLIMLFMVLYYKGAGLAATLALTIYAAIVLAIFKLIPVTLTLAGIGGLILSIGMAVDANVLIFERMKEELRIGRTLSSAIEIGFNRAWPAIRDSNVSTIITSVILIWFGQRLGATLLAGFGTALVIGVFVSLFSSLFISKTLLNLFAATPLGRRRSWYTPESLRVESTLETETESQERRA